MHGGGPLLRCNDRRFSPPERERLLQSTAFEQRGLTTASRIQATHASSAPKPTVAVIKEVPRSRRCFSGGLRPSMRVTSWHLAALLFGWPRATAHSLLPHQPSLRLQHAFRGLPVERPNSAALGSVGTSKREKLQFLRNESLTDAPEGRWCID